MNRFVAVSGPEARVGAFDAMRETATARGWSVVDCGPSLWVAVQGPPVRRRSFASGQAILVGAIAGDDLQSDGAGTLEQACFNLARKSWGRYVALFHDAGRLAGVFRDPSGALDCAVWTSGPACVVASDTPDWLIEATNDHPELSWEAIASVLKEPVNLSTADLLTGWRTVTPGALFVPGGQERVVWSPAKATRLSAPADKDRLRAAVDEAVSGLTRDKSSLLVEVSGGLDSAIMASSLRASGFTGRVLWLNTHGPFAESDERTYATAVAEALGVSLTIVSRSRQDVSQGLVLDHPRSLRPSLNRLDAAYDGLQAELCAAHGLDGVLTGKGGDVAFLQTATSAILADQVQDEGPAALLGPTAPVLARRLRRSAWRVMRAACAGARGSRAPVRAQSALLHPDLRTMEGAPHPWLSDVDPIGPAKRQQILGFAGNLGLHGPSRRSESAELLHPALSQPVMEAVLATPAYILTQGGHDRLLARQAFAHRLPDRLVGRRSKAELSGYYGRVLAANIGQLRPHLLEGRLAYAGLIDRDQVEAALRVEHLIWQGGYGELMILALVESWVRAWID